VTSLSRRSGFVGAVPPTALTGKRHHGTVDCRGFGN
jgi:hypothetical protein